MASMAIYWANFFFGPYDYMSGGSVLSWVYLSLVFLLFWLGLVVGERHRALPKKIGYGSYALSRSLESVLIGIMAIFVAAAIYNLFFYIDLTGGGLGIQAGVARDKLDELGMIGYQRPALARIADGMATCGLAFPLLVLSCRSRFLSTVILAIAIPSLMAVTQLLIGGRNGAALVVTVLTIAFLLRRMAGIEESRGFIRLRRVLAILGVLSVVTMVLMFAWRYGQASLVELNVSEPFIWNGRVTLRDFYRDINNACDGLFSGLYMLSYYFGHSAPFFAALFESSDYSDIHYGLFHFRIFDLIFGRGSAGFIEIVQSQQFYGLYPTAVQGLLLDAGVVATPFVAFAVGLLFGTVANKAIRGEALAGCFLPLILAVVMISPVYYLIWGSSDFVAFGLLALFMGLSTLSLVLNTRLFNTSCLIKK